MKALAAYTVRQTLRSKGIIAGLAVSLLYLAAVPLLNAVSSTTVMVSNASEGGTAGAQFLNYALSGLNLLGMFMAVFVALGSIHADIESGTMAMIVTKPLRRSQVIIGRWAGYALFMAGYVLIIGLVLWLTVVFDTSQPFWNYIPALSLAYLNVATMMTLTLAVSIFMPATANAVLVFLIFIVTSNLNLINFAGGATDASAATTVIDNVFRLSLPVGIVSDQMHGLLVNAGRSTAAASLIPANLSFVYEAVYIAVLLLLATRTFQKKDLV